MKLLLIICFWLTINVPFSAHSQTTPVLKFQEGGVWITGLHSQQAVINFTTLAQEQWASILRVYTHDAFVKKIKQPVAGTYTWHGDSLSFNPNFSFAAGQRYYAMFDYQALLALSESKQAEKIHTFELSFSVPKEKTTSAFIEAMHPQGNRLPENMLRMYISFSQAMMPGEAYEHITLLKEDGTPVEKAFLVIDQELWDPERKRFTLLFDPGRIKRGIQSQVDLGSPLQAGQTYQLVIDSAWRDAHGNPLAGSATKSFTVAAAERSTLDIQQWKIITPDAGTTNDLLIEVDRPIDYVLAMKYITLASRHAGQVRGVATFTGSRYWRFTPDQPWPEDQYVVEVIPQLEDVAGNNFNNAFDIDLSKESRTNTTETIRRSFFIRPVMK